MSNDTPLEVKLISPSLHDQIMRLPCTPPKGANVNYTLGYKSGHRDARHAAAELAAAYEADAQQAVPDGWKLVPIVPTGEMVEASEFLVRRSAFETWERMLAAAPTPPAGPWEIPVAVPDEALELLRIWQTWLGPHRDACDEVGQKLWDRIDAVLSAPTPPAQQSQWVPVSERLPDPDEHSRVLIYTRDVDFQGEQFFDVKAEQLDRRQYEYEDDMPEVCQHASHWMPRPAVYGDTAAPEQAGFRLGYREGATVFAGYLLDNCERETVYEENLQQWLDDMLRTHPATPAPEQAEQPAGTTSDKYRAELYDEVWQKARDMGYGNVTEALSALERNKEQDEQDAVKVLRELLERAIQCLEPDGSTLNTAYAWGHEAGKVADELRALLEADNGDQ